MHGRMRHGAAQVWVAASWQMRSQPQAAGRLLRGWAQGKQLGRAASLVDVANRVVIERRLQAWADAAGPSGPEATAASDGWLVTSSDWCVIDATIADGNPSSAWPVVSHEPSFVSNPASLRRCRTKSRRGKFVGSLVA
eukprot:6213716-Pleurochrysis_carterae.AAC.6